MIKLDKTFIAGKMNKDIDERLIPDGEYLDALNVTIDTSQGSTIGAVQNSRGNDKMSDIATVTGLAVVNARAIGAVAYEAQNLIYWLVTSDNFDAVFEYNQLTDVTTKVLLSTTGQLNFNKNYCVTGINYIPAFGDLGPFLFWSDGLNPPRRINIARAKSWSDDDPRIDLDTQVILRPPLNAPKIYLKTDGDPETTNNIERKFLYFAYRYKYVDNQYSSLSPFSGVAFQGDTFSYDYETGDNKGMQNTYNKVDISIDTGNQFVKEIQVVFYDTSGLNTYVIDNYNKGEIGLSDNVVYTIEFSNNKIYGPLDVSQITRLFDNVPLLAKCQNVIGNRLVYGNYTQFRDIKDAFNQDILIDYNVEVVSTDIPLGGVPVRSFRSDRDYEIGIVYTDEYGRMTTVLTSENNSVYVPSSKSDKSNSIRVTLNNDAPVWATNFRFVLKQPTGEYYNIFPTSFVADGDIRYFLINESDRDKIIVGEYIIFKTGNFSPTYSNRKYKILELEYKSATSPFTVEGLYFKIKANASDTFLDPASPFFLFESKQGRGPDVGIACAVGVNTTVPVKNTSDYVETLPIYYSVTGNNELPLPSPAVKATNISSQTDRRIAIKIVSSTEFQHTDNVALTGWSSSVTITGSTQNIIYGTPGTGNFTNIQVKFDTDGTNPMSQYTIGDIFIFNVRGKRDAVYGEFNGTPLNPSGDLGLIVDDGSGVMSISSYNSGSVIYGGHALLKYNGSIYPGATININIQIDGPNGPGAQICIAGTSTDYYVNLEEWFWKSGSYLTFNQNNAVPTNINANAIVFRRGINPGVDGFSSNYITQSNSSSSDLYMCIRGFGQGNVFPLCTKNTISASLTISQIQTSQKLSAETVPAKTDNDIYYELSKTYRIEGGLHKVSWEYKDFTDGSTVYPSVPEAAGYTVLGPPNPLTPDSASDMKHTFNVGEIVYVRDNSAIYGPANGNYTVVYVPDEYSIVVDCPWPGVSPGSVPGEVYYNKDEQDQTTSIPLVIDINHPTSQNSDFNAFAFGNGVESNRILDAFLQPQMRYSQRALTTIEDYKQQKKETSLTYSGVYVGATQLNKLNEFNLSTGNFKNLDVTYGPIQKLYARDTDLLVLHQDKITSVLYGKNLLVDAVGGGQVASVPEVLGNQVAHPSEYGISNNPESFARHSNILFFADARRGAVLQMINDEVIEISDSGMKNYFRDTMKDNPNTQKLGCFDPFNNQYVISFNDQSVNPCELSIAPTISVTSATAKTLFLFTITSNTSWTLSSNQTWLTLPISSGFGNEDIYGSVELNDGEMFRSAKVTITYCDGLEQEFTLLQLAIPT